MKALVLPGYETAPRETLFLRPSYSLFVRDAALRVQVQAAPPATNR